MTTPKLPGRTVGRQATDVTALMGGIPVAAIDVPRIKAKPTPPFLLRHFPENWFISSTLDTPTLLPEITPHLISPGINGCKTRKKNQPPEAAYRQSVRDAEDKEGWIYLATDTISAEYLPPDVPPGPYIRAIPCETLRGNNPGTHHVDAWNVPGPTLPNRAQRFQHHRPSHERWLASLVESGRVPPCLDYVAEEKIASARERHAKVAQLHRNNLASDGRLEDSEAVLTSTIQAVKGKPKSKRVRK